MVEENYSWGEEGLITKSTGYKIWWAGRYLERIENIARMGLMLVDCGKPLDELERVLGIDTDVFTYLKRNFEFLREDLRSFTNEAVINAVSALEGSIFGKSDDLRQYFSSVLQSALFLGSVVEDQLKPTTTVLYPRKQEEVKTQNDQ